MRADVVDRDQVRVVERPRRARFLLEAAQAIRVLGEGGGEDLDGDVAAEPRVFGAVDLTHPARADGGEDLVGPYPHADGEAHSLLRPSSRWSCRTLPHFRRATACVRSPHASRRRKPG